jgi:pyruvate/2-oxoglutarate dehydrogenase complex dihydrolipoamide acyltransferase (E2) component
MPQVPIIMPQLGESIAEATVISFLANVGEAVQADQDIIEVETNKATMAVTSPCSGMLKALIVESDESYPVGSVLGYVEVSHEDAEKQGLQVAEVSADRGDESDMETDSDLPSTTSIKKKVEPTVRGLPVPASAFGASYMSPRMKARMHELGLHAADLAGIAGSGAGGRITIDDLEKFLTSLEKNKMSVASNMRVSVADAMRRSWTRPIATVGLTVHLDALFEHRKTCNPKPGPTLYALRALALALAEDSTPAGRLVGHQIVHPPSIDVGFAVEAEDGVLVPVMRNVASYALKDLVDRYMELLLMARQRRLPADATGGSIATVTNYGTFGLNWATPIPLPEQTLVLGMGAGRKEPRWDEAQGEFVPVIGAQLTLSFDHRVLDGGAAGRLLTRICALMGQPEIL